MDITLVAEGLADLRRLDAARRLFGSSVHGYELAPPASSRLVGAIESTMGAPLPGDYRRFLTELGDGGAGPYYGILSLESSVERAAAMSGVLVSNETPVEELAPTLPAFTRDSPLSSDVDFGEMIGQPGDWGEHVARLDADPAYAARWDELQEQYLDSPFDGGWIPICDYGCGDVFMLVLRGPRRGTVWVNSLESATGLYCLEVSFGQLYGRWLGDALARVAAQDFAPPNAGYSFLRFGDNPRYR